MVMYNAMAVVVLLLYTWREKIPLRCGRRNHDSNTNMSDVTDFD